LIKKIIILSILNMLFVDQSFAYTKNRGQSGNIIKWKDATTNVSFVFHPNSGTINEQNAFTSSLSEWSNAQAMTLNASIGSGTPSADVNDVYFSNNASLFGGSGVAAVTNVTYDFDTGEILESDIIVNSSMGLSETVGSSNYVGDVLGHEIGHAIGLGHSEVKHSSMFYWLTRGQNTMSQDDLAGAHALYPIGSSSKGKFTGRVAGGTNIGVFGAHVQAISEKTGKVVASNFSESNGSFEIDGLPLDDNYLFYVSPMKNKTTMPEFYSDIRSDFCPSGSSYRGSFYQSCQSSKRGYPQALTLSSSAPSIDLGTISIRCDLDVPQDYLADKEVLFDIPSVDLSGNPGNNMVGYITPDQFNSGAADRLHIDLTNYNMGGSSNLYLEFKVTYQSLYSVMHLTAQAERASVAQGIIDPFNASYATLGSVSVNDADGNPNMELVGKVPLSVSAINNDFEIILTPQSFDDWEASVGSYGSEDFYSRRTQFADSLTFYLLTYRIVQNVSGSYVHYAGPAHTSASSNISCLDAASTYTIVGNVQQSSESASNKRKAKQDDGGFACGSVNISSDGGGAGGSGGFLSFLIGLIVICVISAGQKKEITWFSAS